MTTFQSIKSPDAKLMNKTSSKTEQNEEGSPSICEGEASEENDKSNGSLRYDQKLMKDLKKVVDTDLKRMESQVSEVIEDKSISPKQNGLKLDLNDQEDSEEENDMMVPLITHFHTSKGNTLEKDIKSLKK